MNLGPLRGVALGLVFIMFRKQIASGLTKFYEKFPKWEEGVKILNLKFTVRPIFILLFGSIIIFVSIVALIKLNL